MPLAAGAVLAAGYAGAYWLLCRPSQSRQGRMHGVAVGLVLFVATGVLLWLHAVAAWAAVQLFPLPSQHVWVRFVDEVGPHTAVWYGAAWPWTLVVCCG